MSIPRTIHQIWIGPKPIPDRERQWCAEMARMNPTWKHKLHGNELLERYANDPYVAEMQRRGDKLAFVGDRLRVLLLRDEGGVYLDADCQPLNALDSINCWNWEHVNFVTAMRSPTRRNVALHRAVPFVDNTFMASSKDGRMINHIADLWSPSHIVIDGYSTGICILANADPSAVFLGFKYIYAENQFPETLVLHDCHNLGSWAEAKDFIHAA
jgi:hypothetical protein